MSAACIRTDCDSRSYAFKLYRVVRQVVQRTLGRMPQGIADFITVSEFSRRVLEPRLPAVRRMYAVDNPVDAVRGPRVAAERNQTFAFVGRLSPEKGGVLLAEAARIAGVRVVFIGDGPDRAEIERVNPDAVVTGWLDRAGVRAQLCEARVAVVPSLWYETLGLVVLEAAALGVPAIVSDGTAPRDLITHGETGLGFERGNAPALATRLRACVDDGLVERMSIAAYDGYWRSPPTMGRHVQRLLATYGEVLARLGSGTPQVRSA
jgi:glycosyltransferase involved in cell wall biosynthesis